MSPEAFIVLFIAVIGVMVWADTRAASKVEAAMGDRFDIWSLSSSCYGGNHFWCGYTLRGPRNSDYCLCPCHEGVDL